MSPWCLLLPLAFAIHPIGAEVSIPMLLHKGALSSKGEILDLWKVPLPDNHVKGTDFLKACQTWLMTPVCTGDPSTCMFADNTCVGLAAETQEGCGVPLQGTVKLLGYATNQDPHLKNVCVYIAPGNGYDDGFRCGPAASSSDGFGLSCNSVMSNRYVLCAGSDKMDIKLVNASMQAQQDKQEVKHLRQKNAVLRQVAARERSEIDRMQQKLVNDSALMSSAAATHERIHTLKQEASEQAAMSKVVFVAFVAILGLAYFICMRARSPDLLMPAKVPLLQESPSQAVQVGTRFQPSVSVVEYNDPEGHKVRCVRVVAPGRRIIDNGRSVNGSAKVEVARDGCSTRIHLKLVKEADLPSFAVSVEPHGAPDANGTWEKSLTFPDGTWQRLEPSTSLALDMHGVLQVFLIRKLPPQETQITNSPSLMPFCQHSSINSEIACSNCPGSSVDWLEVAAVSDDGDLVSSIGVIEALDQAVKQGVQSSVAAQSVGSGKNGTGHSVDEEYGGAPTLVPTAPAVEVAVAADDDSSKGDAPSAAAAAIDTAEDSDGSEGSEGSWVSPPSVGKGH